MRFGLIAWALLTFSSCWSQQVRIERYVLPNGMKIILHEDHSLPVVSVNIWYSVGSKDEPERRSGFAHLFEHLMFMGTHRVPQGQFDKIMEAGGGDNNASTAEDRTNFYDWGPSNLLPTLLWLEADRLEDLGNSIDQKKLDLQRDVVKNERRQTTENTPYGRAYEAINGLMFPTGHPYHTSVIGSMQDLDNASVQDVKDFFSTYYVPNNASMVVAGDFSPPAVKPLITSLFGTLPRKNDVSRKSVPALPAPTLRRMTFVDSVQASKTVMEWHSPAHYAPGDAELNLAASILTDGVSSRLYQRLVVKDKLASDVSAGQDERLLGSLFSVDATAAPGASLDKLEGAIDDEIAKLAKDGPTPDELARQAVKLESSIDSGLQSTRGTADQLNEFQFYLGRPDGYKYLLDSYRAVTVNSLRQVVGSTLRPNARLILRIIPETPPVPKQDPRDARPAMAPPSPFQAPRPARFTLFNGLKVEYWQRPQVPLMELSLSVNHGSDTDPKNKLGLASLALAMLSQGSNGLSAEEFERRLDRIGGHFGASSSVRSSSVSLSVLSRNFEKALALYAGAIEHPDFPETAFENVKRVRMEEIEQENDDPSAVALKVERKEFFGDDNPLGRPAEGLASTLANVTQGDLRAVYQGLVRPEAATLFAAGSLPVAVVERDLNAALGQWRAAGAPQKAAAILPPAVRSSRLVVVDRPGAVQTVIRFMFPSVPLSDPHRQEYLSLGTILGGTFTSRLNQNLRENKGYTYGASASFTLLPQVGYLSAEADVRVDVTGASLGEFLKEFRRLQTGDVTDAEAASAASTRRAEAIDSLATLEGLVSVAEGYELEGRDFRDFGKDLADIARVTPTQLNALARTAIPLDKALIVLVGDKSAIMKQLEGLGLPAPVAVLSVKLGLIKGELVRGLTSRDWMLEGWR